MIFLGKEWTHLVVTIIKSKLLKNPHREFLRIFLSKLMVRKMQTWLNFLALLTNTAKSFLIWRENSNCSFFSYSSIPKTFFRGPFDNVQLRLLVRGLDEEELRVVRVHRELLHPHALRNLLLLQDSGGSRQTRGQSEKTGQENECRQSQGRWSGDDMSSKCLFMISLSHADGWNSRQ